MVLNRFRPFHPSLVRLATGVLARRFALNRDYVASLDPAHLLQNFYWEAGLRQTYDRNAVGHWGWESPTCQVRGHFLGHWLSAAARIYATTADSEIKARADTVVAELGWCQRENGGEWVGSIPEKYLHRIARGQGVWAPHYVLHKTLMGLIDMHRLAGNEQALGILVNWARWFHRWTAPFSRERMDDILDVETGGMLEAWADLYAITGKEEHLDLMRRYDRPRLFEPLLAGEDVLTDRHANTTIPEAHGAARAWEVTGEKRWRDIVEAYWRCAVTDRGYFCTGGQTSGEYWTPRHTLSARLGSKNQEHCTVYNMMRLADYLLRWTGAVEYADYWERNLYNGILAQQHPGTGMVAYFLPLRSGSTKRDGRGWGTPTEDFWCCHGTLVQAHTLHNSAVFFEDEEGLAVCQFIPSSLTWPRDGGTVRLTLSEDPQTGLHHRPGDSVFVLRVESERPQEFSLKVRMPWWLAGKPTISVNGGKQTLDGPPSSFALLRRTWRDDSIRIELPRRVVVCPLPDESNTMAFLDGPVVLAGLCGEERTLYGDPNDPSTFLTSDNEREGRQWRLAFRTRNQPVNFRFVPLHEIADEIYTVYFPVQPSSNTP